MCRPGARSPAPRPPLAALRARGSAPRQPAPPLLSAEVRSLGELRDAGLGAPVRLPRTSGECGRLSFGHCGAAGLAPRKAGAPAGCDRGVSLVFGVSQPGPYYGLRAKSTPAASKQVCVDATGSARGCTCWGAGRAGEAPSRGRRARTVAVVLVASHHVWSWLDVHRQLHQPLLRQEPGDARSESLVGLGAGFGVRTASLLGGNIRQKLLPLSPYVPKPGFRSAKGFLRSLDELEHRQRQN